MAMAKLIIIKPDKNILYEIDLIVGLNVRMFIVKLVDV